MLIIPAAFALRTYRLSPVGVWNGWLDLTSPRDWRHYVAYEPVLCVDGKERRGWVSRRRCAGRWEYKALTKEEQAEAEEWQATR
jgi:hypothetical protein